MNFLQFCDGRNDLRYCEKDKNKHEFSKKIHKKLLKHRLIR